MNDSIKVSLIIPIYNAQETLRCCLDSITAQSYQVIEVILVDDESTDQSAEICKEYCSAYPQIFTYIRQTNGGPAKARNTGIDRATGEYLAFVDADDYIEPNMLSSMVEAAEQNNADMIICAYFKDSMNKSSSIQYKHATGIYKKESTWELALMLIDETNLDDLPPYSWVRLTKASVIQDSSLRFSDGIVRSEDYHFWVKVHFQVNSVYVLNKPLYHYVENSKSITHSHIEHYWEDVLFIYRNLLEELPDRKEIRRRLGIMLLRRAMIALNNASRCKEASLALEEIKSIVYDKDLDHVIRKLDAVDVKRYKMFPVLMKSHGKWLVVMKYYIRYLKK